MFKLEFKCVLHKVGNKTQEGLCATYSEALLKMINQPQSSVPGVIIHFSHTNKYIIPVWTPINSQTPKITYAHQRAAHFLVFHL